MTPKEEKIIQRNLEEIASILYKNTQAEELEDFATIELTVRKQILNHVTPTLGNFFLTEGMDIKKEEDKEK